MDTFLARISHQYNFSEVELQATSLQQTTASGS